MNNQEGKARQKPHKCEAYGRQFWFSADLHQHQKHSGEKFSTAQWREILQEG